MLPSRSAPSAPISDATGRRKSSPAAAITTPENAAAYTTSENVSSAFFRFPSPSVFAISAPPPVPNRNPAPPSSMRSGMMKLTAANAVFPVKFETKNPSTTPYTDVNTSITTDGNVKRRSRAIVK